MGQNNRLFTIEAIKQHVFNGLSIFTIHNIDTNTHFTYKIEKAKKSDMYWVYVLTMKDNDDKKSYKFLGGLSHADGYKYSTNSYIKENSKSNVVAVWFFALVFNGLLTERYRQIMVYKSTSCVKCGHLLTAPESIIREMGDCCFEASYPLSST